MCKKMFCGILLLGILGAAQVQGAELTWIKAAYLDTRYASAWAGAGGATATALEAAGYEILDADQLKTWMTARIADKKLSVVVMTQDAAPDTVAETMTANCTLRKYLEAGGKIVCYGDIPFYYQSNSSAVNTTWGDNGAPGVLGFNTSSAPRDSGNTVKITAAGTRWGLTQTWTSQRPLLPSVTTNVTILATDNAGNAGGWVKHYLAGDTFRGFVRFRDTGGQASVDDIIRVAEYMNIKASSPSPADGATGVTLPLFQWSPGGFAVFHSVYFGTTPELTEANLVSPRQFPLMYFHTGALVAGATYYWRIDEIEADGTIRTGDVWKVTMAPITAFAPSPRNGDKWIDPNSNPTWTPGQGAITHDVYFGTDEAAVTNRDASAFKGNQVGASYEPGTLPPETTYFWAIDELAAGNVKNAGAVWSFTTAGGSGGGVKGEYFQGMTPAGAPALTRTDANIDFSWGEASPGDPIGVDQFSVRWTADLEIAVADTYTFTSSTDDGVRVWLNNELIIDQWVDQGTTDVASKAMELQPGIYSLQMDYYENGVGAVARLFWETPTVARAIIPSGPLQPPVRARALYPANGAVDIPQDITLMWGAGDKAKNHQVYFGEDANAVANATTADAGIYQGQQALDQMTFDPGTLEWDKTYYWRVDEVNPAEAGSPWKGSVWSFTTANFIVVDDMESYTDAEPSRIFDTWLDGYDGSSGSIVGYLNALGGTFGETSIVHGGKQSMPFEYDNSKAPYYSEAVREFSPVQNWTVNGVTDLTLFVRGNPGLGAAAVTETGGKMDLTGAGADIWNNSDEFTYAYKTLTGDGTMTARVVSTGTGANTWAKGGVMIRDSINGGSTHATMAITGGGGNGASFQYRAAANGASANVDSGSVIAPPYWVKMERMGDVLTGYVSSDGKLWNTLGTTTVTMADPIYIGLAVTSHVAGTNRTYQFDSISATGGVSGAWQGAVINSPSHNSAQKLYVTVEDSAGKKATTTHDTAVTTDAWTEVKMPLSGFAGVSMSKVKKVTIGVGDRANPVADGTGLIFVDDIRVTKP